MACAHRYYELHYDGAVPDERRIDQVIAWLRLPAPKRPHFITLYYSQPDSAGHENGPDSPETAEAVRHVDGLIGILAAKLKALKLPVDLIVVSDHGMETVQGNWIDLDKYADLTNFDTDGAFLYPKGGAAEAEATAEKAYNQLKKADSRFVVYRRARVPAAFDFNQNPREGDPIIVPTGPYIIRAHAPYEVTSPGRRL